MEIFEHYKSSIQCLQRNWWYRKKSNYRQASVFDSLQIMGGICVPEAGNETSISPTHHYTQGHSTIITWGPWLVTEAATSDEPTLLH